VLVPRTGGDERDPKSAGSGKEDRGRLTVPVGADGAPPCRCRLTPNVAVPAPDNRLADDVNALVIEAAGVDPRLGCRAARSRAGGGDCHRRVDADEDFVALVAAAPVVVAAGFQACLGRRARRWSFAAASAVLSMLDERQNPSFVAKRVLTPAAAAGSGQPPTRLPGRAGGRRRRRCLATPVHS